jgi:hypothetical protein
VPNEDESCRTLQKGDESGKKSRSFVLFRAVCPLNSDPQVGRNGQPEHGAALPHSLSTFSISPVTGFSRATTSSPNSSDPCRA